jgi:hypothetical protein
MPLSAALAAHLGPEFEVDSPLAEAGGPNCEAMIPPPVAKRVRKRAAIAQLPHGRVLSRGAGLTNGCLCCFANAVVQLLRSDANIVRALWEHVESGAADEQDALLLEFLLGSREGRLCGRALADAHGCPPGFGDPVAFLHRLLCRQLWSRPWVDQVAGFTERGRGERLLAFAGSESAGLADRFARLTSPQDVLLVVNATPDGIKVDINREFHVDVYPFALTSFVAHIGTRMEGHDVTFIRGADRPGTGGWFCADDNVLLGYTDRCVFEIFANKYALVRPVILCFSRNWKDWRPLDDVHHVPDPADWGEPLRGGLPDPAPVDEGVHGLESWDPNRSDELWACGRVEDWAALRDRFPEMDEAELRLRVKVEHAQRGGGSPCNEQERAVLDSWLDADPKLRCSMKELALILGDRWTVGDVRGWTRRIRYQRKADPPRVPLEAAECPDAEHVTE